jgi:hypothetical protein
MKKLVMLAITTLALTGCASRYAGPAVVGGAIGYSIANSQPRTVVIQQQPQIREQVIVVNQYCGQYATQSEQVACNRGAQQRYNEEQRRRENEAYRAGYGR